jgi:hypothetical protein
MCAPPWPVSLICLSADCSRYCAWCWAASASPAVLGFLGTINNNNNSHAGEETMRVPWRTVRPGHEREDQAHNEMLAERLVSNPAVDEYVISFGVLGWKLVGPHGERWPMQVRTMLVPEWAQSVAEAEADARRGAAIVAEIDKHRPKPRLPKSKADG